MPDKARPAEGDKIISDRTITFDNQKPDTGGKRPEFRIVKAWIDGKHGNWRMGSCLSSFLTPACIKIVLAVLLATAADLTWTAYFEIAGKYIEKQVNLTIPSNICWTALGAKTQKYSEVGNLILKLLLSGM